MANKHIHAMFYSLVLLAFIKAATSNTESINIDCGGSNYTSNSGGWLSDLPYIFSGSTAEISALKIPVGSSFAPQMTSLRYFPDEQVPENCYNVLLPSTGRYLVKLSFLYLNYDGKASAPTFNVTIGQIVTGPVTIVDGYLTEEEYVVDMANYSANGATILNLCLVRVEGVPFINAMQIHKLPTQSYNSSEGTLRLTARLSAGNPLEYVDTYGRSWTPDINVDPTKYGKLYTFEPTMNTSALTTTSDIDDLTAPGYVPLSVAQTARQTSFSTEAMEYTFQGLDYPRKYHVYLHFAELDNTTTLGYRVFDVLCNDEIVSLNFDVYNMAGRRKFRLVTLPISTNLTSSSLTITLKPNVFTTLPPMITAIELFQLFPNKTALSVVLRPPAPYAYSPQAPINPAQVQAPQSAPAPESPLPSQSKPRSSPITPSMVAAVAALSALLLIPFLILFIVILRRNESHIASIEDSEAAKNALKEVTIEKEVPTPFIVSGKQ